MQLAFSSPGSLSSWKVLKNSLVFAPPNVVRLFLKLHSPNYHRLHMHVDRPTNESSRHACIDRILCCHPKNRKAIVVFAYQIRKQTYQISVRIKLLEFLGGFLLYNM